MASKSTNMLVDAYEELSYLSAFVEDLPIMDNRINYLQSIIYDVVQPIEDMLSSNGWDTEQLRKNGLEKTRTN